MVNKIFYSYYSLYFNRSYNIVYDIIFVLIVIAAIISFKFFKSRDKKDRKDFENYLTTLDSFQIKLDDIKIDGFGYKETVPISRYGNEMNLEGDNQSPIENFHRNVDKTRYYSLLYIPIKYKKHEKEYELRLPLEDTNIKIRFHLQKTAKVYVTKDFKFIIDFSFFEKENISYVSI